MSSSRYRYRIHLVNRSKSKRLYDVFFIYSEFFWEYIICTGIQWNGKKSQVNLFQVDGELSSFTRRNWQTAPPKARISYHSQLVPL